MLTSLLGGIGLFLLGMVLMTEALKGLGGAALRRMLTRLVAGPVSGVAWGAATTALVQSSTATTLTTIGFVSAGILTFPQAVGVIFGANIGTTSTGWLVSLLGLKFSIGKVALPAVFVGAATKLLGHDRIASWGTVLAGFGLIFIGIDALQAGMAGLAAHVSPSDLPGTGWGGRSALLGLGLVMTIVMQSSSAAMATTLAAVHAGTISLDQAAAMVIGQNIGTAVTTSVAAIGGSVPARRTAAAHVLFNVITGAMAFALLPVFTVVVTRIADAIGGERATIALAAFHTVFNLVGVGVLLPLVGPFSRAIERLVPERDGALTHRLDRSVALLGPVAVEAVRRTVGDIAAVVLHAARGIMTGSGPMRSEYARLASAEEALHGTRSFLARLGAAPQTDDEQRRHLSSLHAIDHLTRLIDACRERDPAGYVARSPVFHELAGALGSAAGDAAGWLRQPVGPSPADRLAEVSASIATRRRTHRVVLLERAARGGTDPEETLAELEAMRWIDRLAYHTWRTVHHLQEPPPAPSGISEVHEERPGA
jgi:phosphate:Na+ symporter